MRIDQEGCAAESARKCANVQKVASKVIINAAVS